LTLKYLGLLLFRNKDKIQKNKTYINEIGEESFLTDLSEEEYLPENKENAKQLISGENEVQNEYNYNQKELEPFKREINPFDNREV